MNDDKLKVIFTRLLAVEKKLDIIFALYSESLIELKTLNYSIEHDKVIENFSTKHPDVIIHHDNNGNLI